MWIYRYFTVVVCLLGFEQAPITEHAVYYSLQPLCKLHK